MVKPNGYSVSAATTCDTTVFIVCEPVALVVDLVPTVNPADVICESALVVV
jgi:hypothetical protein